MELSEIKPKITELFENSINVISVGYGYKTKNGQKTNQKSIIYRVEKKKPISDLSEEEKIPSEVEIGGEIFVTDVVESYRFKSHACDTQTEQQCISRVTPYSNMWNDTLIPNRLSQRPLKGGCSMTRTTIKGSGVGTFGFIAVDSETQSLVGVTNNHVAARIGFITSDFPSDGDVYYNTLVEEVYQTGEPEAIITENEKIGRVRNAYPLRISQFNLIDAATIVLDEDVIDNSVSFNQVGIPFNNAFPFATSEEIDNLLLDDSTVLAASGRSTGVKYSGECPIQIDEIGVNLFVDDYGWFKNGFTVQDLPFSDCIIYKRSNPDCLYPSYGGDSGSGVLGYINGEWKLIGLNFAGGGNIGAMCRIDHVAELLGLESWDGSPKNFLDKDNPEYYYSENFSDEEFIIINGKKYWQVGLINNP